MHHHYEQYHINNKSLETTVYLLRIKLYFPEKTIEILTTGTLKYDLI